MTRATGLAAAALTVVAVAACASSSSTSSSPASTSAPAAGSTATATASPATASPAASSSGTTLKTTTIDGTEVLTNSAGMTLYWFVPDTSTKSNCTGSCATYWPPVAGPATAGSGVTGTLGVITRAGGAMQATYDGHPLYTYIGDKAPGQNKGNDINASGGLWWEMTVSGAKPTSATSATSGSTSAPTGTSTTSTGGGYGY